jgi:hypothetical protein
MYAHKLTTIMTAAVAAATLALAAAPSQAQTTDTKSQSTAVKKKPAPTRVATAGRPPARVTVRQRSYLDPGTETKGHNEHYQDYAFPPGGTTSFVPGPGDSRFDFTRMPFPNCFDLAGFCR